jgi:hypothetical protein
MNPGTPFAGRQKHKNNCKVPFADRQKHKNNCKVPFADRQKHKMNPETPSEGGRLPPAPEGGVRKLHVIVIFIHCFCQFLIPIPPSGVRGLFPFFCSFGIVLYVPTNTNFFIKQSPAASFYPLPIFRFLLNISQKNRNADNSYYL